MFEASSSSEGLLLPWNTASVSLSSTCQSFLALDEAGGFMSRPVAMVPGCP